MKVFHDVVRDPFKAFTEMSRVLRVTVAKIVASIKAPAAGFAQPGQPRTEADDEPLAKIERLEEDY